MAEVNFPLINTTSAATPAISQTVPPSEEGIVTQVASAALQDRTSAHVTDSASLTDTVQASVQTVNDLGQKILETESTTVQEGIEQAKELLSEASTGAMPQGHEEAANSLYERISTWLSETKDSISTTVSSYYTSVTSQIDQTAASVKNSEIVQSAFKNDYVAAIAPVLPYVGGAAGGFLVTNGTIHLMSAYNNSFKKEKNIQYLKTVGGEAVRPRVSKLQGVAALTAGSLTLLATHALSKEADKAAVLGTALATSVFTSLVTSYTNPIKHTQVLKHKLY